MKQDMIDARELYKNLPVLETPRLILRKVTLDDLQDIFAYSSDERVTRYLQWGPHKTMHVTKGYIRSVLQDYESGKDGPWGIEYQQTGRLIGSVHLMGISAQHSKAEIGFVLSKAHWKSGLMTEALRKVLAYSFEDVGLNRIEGFCLVENQASMGVMRKVGMRQEGLLREYLYLDGAYRDYYVYSILKRDYGLG